MDLAKYPDCSSAGDNIPSPAIDKRRVRGFADHVIDRELVQHGIVLVKYWLHVTADEQLRRFKERESTPHKVWKLTDEDWRNRTKWDAYEAAVNDMIERTSTHDSPWTLVESNDKNYARVKVLKTAARALEKALS